LQQQHSAFFSRFGYFICYQMHYSTEFVFIDRWWLRIVQCVRRVLVVLFETIIALPYWVLDVA